LLVIPQAHFETEMLDQLVHCRGYIVVENKRCNASGGLESLVRHQSFSSQ